MDHPDSVYDHGATTIGNIGNKVLAVGHVISGDNYNGHNKVELFDINSEKWTTKASFPFCSS